MLRRLRPLLLAATLLTPGVIGSACTDEATPPPVELRSAGASVSIALAPFRITIKDAAGATTLETATTRDDARYAGPAATRDEGLDGVKLLPGWDGFVPAELPWSGAGAASVTAQAASSASFAIAASGGTLDVDVSLEDAKVTIKTTARGAGWNKTSLAFSLRPDEHFFGLGERFGSIDHRGLSLYSWAEEGGTGGGEERIRDDATPGPNGASMTYFPVPFVLSSAGYGLHLATTYRTETHFGSERPDAWRAAVNDATLTAVVYVHASPLASLDDYTRDTGRPLVPATWVFGPRRRVSSGQMALGIPEVDALRKNHVPTTGVDDAVHLLPNRSELGREDELRQWIAGNHAKGFKVMAYNNPYVSMTIEAARSDLDHGTAAGFFALDADGTVARTSFISGQPQDLATIDLTRPEAVAWFQDLLRRTLALGYDGWMHDFGEYVRRSWKFADGRTGEAVHNEFPVLSAKAAHDLLVAERRDDFLFFVRSGYSGTQQYVPAVWGGDAEATFDETQGLPSVLRGGVNLGMSGVPYWGSDVSGYKCLTDYPRDKEVYLRWAEFGAVSPIMMEQNACSNPIGDKREKWKLWNDQETIDVYGAMARLHTRLAPYFEVLAREANRSGAPIMRHPFLVHPREPEAWAADSSFYLGPSLYASPVVRRGVTVKDTWLPPGTWVDIADLAVYRGGAHAQIPAPLGKLPLLLADGGIVPLLDPSIDTLAPATDASVISPERVADRLDVLVALTPGKEAHLVLADGTELTARRKQAGGGSSGLAQVTPGEIADCAGCFAVTDEGGVSRLRVTTAKTQAVTLTQDDIELVVTGSPVTRRFRWDVLRPKP
ncbi:MAG: Alpha-xylosidase [Labilithrix sp.]|nr:Alpha-xylosidase [Labilithrix sp.]